MKKILFNILCIALISFAIVGCQQNEFDAATGGLKVNKLIINSNSNSIDVSSKSAVPPVMAFEIYDESNVVVYSVDDYTVITDPIPLSTGSYTAKAFSSVGLGFDSKAYIGEKEFIIEYNKNTELSIECGLNSILADVTYTQIVKDNFTDYSVILSTKDGDINCVKGETRTAYFPYSEVLDYTINLTNNLGDKFSASGSVLGLHVTDFVHFTVDVIEKEVNDKEDFFFDLVINQTINDVVTTVTLDLTPNDFAIPYITFNGGEVADFYMVKEGVGIVAKFDVNAEAGVKKLFLTIPDENSTKTINLFTSTELEILGISTEIVESQTSGIVDISAYTSMLSSGNLGQRDLVISLGIYDNALNYITQKLNISIVKSSIFTVEPEVGSVIDWSTGLGFCDVVFNASYVSSEMPIAATFKYRVKDAATWQEVLVADLIVDSEAKTYSVNLKLNLGCEYEVRAISGEDNGAIEAFKTISGPALSNMSFDDWHVDGKTYYPYVSGGVKEWDSGNGGLTSSLVNKPSNVIYVEDFVAHGTRALKQTSVDAPVVGFAAGNLFSGFFRFSIGDALGNPLNMVKFGRPFEGRPTHLTGFYCYKPVTINTGKAHDGEMDQCHIYISLESWGGSSSRPSDRTVIGYGELKDSEWSDVYKEFSIEIDYSGNLEMPDHIVIVGTSSIYGEQYIGGKGSVLYLDGFEFKY